MRRVYRLSLFLLPSALRLKHGAQMEAMYQRNLDEARARGPWNATASVVSGIADVVRRGVYEQLRSRPHQLENEFMTMPGTREIMRNHARSFVVAYVLLTVALFVPFVARQVIPRATNGMFSSAAIEMLLLGVPFISALTIPMAVLVAVLYEFSRLGKNGTLATAKATRDGVKRLVLPVAFAATGMTALAFVVTAEIVPRSNAQLANVYAGREVELGDRSMTIGALRQAATSAAVHHDQDSESQVVSYEVEIQKKLALPAACLLLALAGMALAFRLPRGGMPLVFIGGLTVFGAYYVLIMAGESLADQFVVSPFVGMWGANAFVLLLAVAAMWSRPRQASAT
jgi:lipopolysaccharide export LptBFGC system permease protein LptF